MALPASREERDKIATRIGQVYVNELSTAWTKIYTEMEEALRYIAGEQYSDKQIEWATTQRRPTNVYNLTLSLYNRVLGDFFLTDLSEKVYPHGKGDPAIAKVMQDLLDLSHINCEWRNHLGRTIFSGHVKFGYLYSRYSDELDIDGSVITTNIDEIETGFDSRSHDYFFDDARYWWRARWMLPDDIFAAWPEHKAALMAALQDREEAAYFAQLEGSQAYANATSPNLILQGKYKVIEFYDRYPERVPVAYDIMSGEADIFIETGKKLERYLAANPNRRMVDMDRRVKHKSVAIPALSFLLESDLCQLQDETADIIPFSAYSYASKTIDYWGLFKNAKGPQDGFNDWKNATQHIINQSGNVGFNVKPKNILNYREIKNRLNEPGSVAEIKDGFTFADSIERREGPTYPFATEKMAEDEATLFEKITGITANLKGRADRNQANASLYAQEVREAMKMMNTISHNLSRTKARVCKKEMKLIQQFYTMEKQFTFYNMYTKQEADFTINQQAGERILNDLTIGEYQIYPDDIEKNPTARMLRQMEKDRIVQIAITLFGPQAQFVIPPEWWLRDSDLGDMGEFVQGWKNVAGMNWQVAQQNMAMGNASQLLAAAKQRNELIGEDGADPNAPPKVREPQTK